MSEPGRHSGGCLCGAVRFELTPPLRDILVCHCSLCRRAGSNAAAYTSVRRSALRLLESDGLATYIDVNDRERSFCCICGSSLFWAEDGADSISVSAGALDGETGLRISAHVWGASAADWELLPADVPAHRESSSSPRL